MIVNRLCVLFLLVYYTFASKSYENYKVYSVVPDSVDKVKAINNLHGLGFDIWNNVLVKKSVNIMVAPHRENYFFEYTENSGMIPILKIENLQDVINNQLKAAKTTPRNSIGSFSFEQYHNLEEIYAWLDEVQQLYPDVVTSVNMGTSFDGRNIKGIIMDFKPGERGAAPLTAMIEGGIHAREWISPSAVAWIIKEFLTSDDSDIRFMAEAFVWHIFPVTNPDGYVYSFTNNRMWRKNRNKNFYTNCSHWEEDDDLSNGVDLNRNFDYLWMLIGASDDPCTLIYAGPSPASEPETQAIVDYVLQLKENGNLLYYFSFHSASQWIMIPFSMNSGHDVLEADNFADMYEMAIRGVDKLTAKYGTEYEVGTLRQILEFAELSGSSFDWVKGVAKVPVVYLFELRDQGEYSFLLPPEKIIPNNEEIMECLLEIDRTARRLGYYYSGTVTGFGSTVLLCATVLFLYIFQ